MTLLADLRYAVRLLLRSPVFTVTAVLSLATGVAGTSAIFSLADAVLLRPRPGVIEPATLIDIGRSTAGQGLDNFGYPLFEEMRRRSTLLQGMAAHRFAPEVMSLGDAHESQRVFAALVSGNYFEVVGARPALGRFFLPEEDRTPDTHPVVVLSHDFWSRRFATAPDVAGQTIRLNNRPYTIIGVAQQGFAGTTMLAPDFWVPMAMDAHVRAASTSLLHQHGPVWLTALGRLKPGATIAQARDELQAIMAAYLNEHRDPRADRWGVAVARSARIPVQMAGPVVGFLGMLAVLTGLVLAIACSNVAGMLLARGLERRREIATRLALGASRRRIVAQLLLEGVTLAMVAGVLSIPLTSLLVSLLAGYQPSLPVPLALDLRVDARVQICAFALTGLAALAFALLPALQTTRVDVAPALHGANASTDRRRAWLRQTLVAGQVAIAVLLLVAAGLFLRSLQEAAQVDVGFNADAVDTLQIDTAIAGYRTHAEGVRAIDALMERFSSLPGVSSAAASHMVPLQGGRLGLGALRAPGAVGPDGSDTVPASWDVVTTEYFETLQIPIVAGRSFDGQDGAAAPGVAILSQTMASRLWPGQNPIGRTLIQEGLDGPRTLHVVGVARDVRNRSLAQGPENFIYVPLAQQFMSNVTIYVRRQPGPSRVQDLRRAVAAFDPTLPVIHMETLEAATALSVLPQRIAAWIASAVGSIGLFLAALGIYGLTTFSIAQRRREFAIRLAIGAPPAAVVRLALRQAATLTAIGAATGGVLAVAVASLLGSFLIGVQPIDPIAFATALLLLGGVMFGSSWAPARRAAVTDPVRALRVD